MKINFSLIGVPAICITVFGVYLMKIFNKNKKDMKQDRINVLSDHFQLLNHWLEVKNEGKSVASYFETLGYHHIAIYGMAELSNRLFDDLAGSSIIIDYGIDRDASCTIGRIEEIYSPDGDLPHTDVIVVTPYSSFDTIKKSLQKQVECPIVSLEEVVWSV